MCLLGTFRWLRRGTEYLSKDVLLCMQADGRRSTCPCLRSAVLPGSQGLSKKSMQWRRGAGCWVLPVRSIQTKLCSGKEHLCGGWANRICWPYWTKWSSRVDFKDRRMQGSREEKIGERRMMCGWVGLIRCRLQSPGSSAALVLRAMSPS